MFHCMYQCTYTPRLMLPAPLLYYITTPMCEVALLLQHVPHPVTQCYITWVECQWFVAQFKLWSLGDCSRIRIQNCNVVMFQNVYMYTHVLHACCTPKAYTVNQGHDTVYVTWHDKHIAMCWQSMFHWSAWVTIQPLLRLRHNAMYGMEELGNLLSSCSLHCKHFLCAAPSHCHSSNHSLRSDFITTSHTWPTSRAFSLHSLHTARHPKWEWWRPDWVLLAVMSLYWTCSDCTAPCIPHRSVQAPQETSQAGRCARVWERSPQEGSSLPHLYRATSQP